MNYKEKEEFIKRFSKCKWICNLEKRVVIKKISEIELDKEEELYYWQVENDQLPEIQRTICTKLSKLVPLTLRELKYERKRRMSF